jgi:hypothetical protein
MRFFGPKESSEIKEIREAANVVGESSSGYFCQNFKTLMGKLFNPDKTIASILFDAAVSATTNDWIENTKSFVSILEPKSKFGEALITNRDIRIDL